MWGFMRMHCTNVSRVEEKPHMPGHSLDVASCRGRTPSHKQEAKLQHRIMNMNMVQSSGRGRGRSSVLSHPRAQRGEQISDGGANLQLMGRINCVRSFIAR
jgi:hypothetical protein